MKNSTVIILILIVQNCIAQQGFNFPSELVINPYESALFPVLGTGNVKIKSITQYKTFSRFTMDTLTPKQNDFYPEFVLEFDSLGHLISMKYDFEPHLSKMKFVDGRLQIEKIESISKEDSTHLFIFSIDNITRIYNYYENKFYYGLNELERIQILSPIRYGFRGVLDGVYVQENPTLKVCTTTHKDENGNITRIESYSDDQLLSSTDYLYLDLERNGISMHLIHKVVETSKNQTVEHILKYEFY